MHKTILILWYLLLANTTFSFTRQDTLRGGNRPHRAWWDAQHYALQFKIDTSTHSIQGAVTLRFKVIQTPTDSLQIDLQQPLEIISAKDEKGQPIAFSRDGNVYWLRGNFNTWPKGDTHTLTLTYQGQPRTAKNAPWDGGLIWTEDTNGQPWFAVACQGLGASSWWPCKDDQRDEPQEGVTITFDGNSKQAFVANGAPALDTYIVVDPVTGKERSVVKSNPRKWVIKNPINLYDVTFYLGDYVQWQDTLHGEKGILPLRYYALRQDSLKARQQFEEVKPMLRCFEHWMGPYPFYEDGYKIVQAPYLGMEHQSAIAYGNQFLKGYLGSDRSKTGVGLNWDYIIIHESGHEWFGNNITAQDPADNWIHEGLTSYTEALYSEWILGKDAGYRYAEGLYKNIDNDKPVIGAYGVNDEGSGDRYDKGQAVIHMVRMMMNDDEKFRQMLRKMNDTFYHQTITSAQMEAFIIGFSGLPLQKFFDQYLRSTQLPKINISKRKKQLQVRLSHCVPGLVLPMHNLKGKDVVLSEQWSTLNPMTTEIYKRFLWAK